MMMMMMMKKVQVWMSVLIVCGFLVQSAEASTYEPKLCYMLDGFLGVYGLFITGMFFKEKFFRTKVKEEKTYKESETEEEELERGGRVRRPADDPNYTFLKNSDREYRELPAKRERHKKNDQVYQDLSTASRDTYNTLQMQPLSVR